MGWNMGGYIFEQQIIALYDKGLLTEDVLNTIAIPFCDTDCDTAGFRNKKSKDGKNIYEIICLVLRPNEYSGIKDSLTYTSTCHNFECSIEGYALWKDIWENQWGIF